MIALANLSPTATELLPVTAVVDSALCVGAGGSSGSLTDKPMLKNAEGRLVIPASQVKGRLRHECEKLLRGLTWSVCESPMAAQMCPQRASVPGDFMLKAYRLRDFSQFANQTAQYHCLICQLFGNPALPARLRFSDLICTAPPDALPEVLRPGVTINRRRRTAEDQKLYFLETSPANARLAFTGNIEILPAWPTAEADLRVPDFARALLQMGIAHIHALGGSKSTGLGWLSWTWPEGKPDPISEDVWTFLGSAATQAKDESSLSSADNTRDQTRSAAGDSAGGSL